MAPGDFSESPLLNPGYRGVLPDVWGTSNVAGVIPPMFFARALRLRWKKPATSNTSSARPPEPMAAMVTSGAVSSSSLGQLAVASQAYWVQAASDLQSGSLQRNNELVMQCPWSLGLRSARWIFSVCEYRMTRCPAPFSYASKQPLSLSCGRKHPFFLPVHRSSEPYRTPHELNAWSSCPFSRSLHSSVSDQLKHDPFGSCTGRAKGVGVRLQRKEGLPCPSGPGGQRRN